MHLVFGYPGVHVKNGTKFLPGMDSRADGGYIVAAPSTHISGKQYRWVVELNGSLPVLPTALVNAINGMSPNAERLKFDSKTVWEGIPEGQRDHQLFRYACQLRHYGAPRDVAEQLILEGAARCKPPFSSAVALRKVEQAYEKYSPGETSKPEKTAAATEHRFLLVSARDIMATEDIEAK